MGSLLSLDDAAIMLSMSPKALRRIVDRSRDRASGAKKRGPVIQFHQAGRGGAIKFRPQWLEDFIDHYTIDPASPESKRPAAGMPGAGIWSC